jgi:hypothetical protein
MSLFALASEELRVRGKGLYGGHEPVRDAHHCPDYTDCLGGGCGGGCGGVAKLAACGGAGYTPGGGAGYAPGGGAGDPAGGGGCPAGRPSGAGACFISLSVVGALVGVWLSFAAATTRTPQTMAHIQPTKNMAVMNWQIETTIRSTGKSSMAAASSAPPPGQRTLKTHIMSAFFSGRLGTRPHIGVHVDRSSLGSHRQCAASKHRRRLQGPDLCAGSYGPHVC